MRPLFLSRNFSAIAIAVVPVITQTTTDRRTCHLISSVTISPLEKSISVRTSFSIIEFNDDHVGSNHVHVLGHACLRHPYLSLLPPHACLKHGLRVWQLPHDGVYGSSWSTSWWLPQQERRSQPHQETHERFHGLVSPPKTENCSRKSKDAQLRDFQTTWIGVEVVD